MKYNLTEQQIRDICEAFAEREFGSIAKDVYSYDGAKIPYTVAIDTSNTMHKIPDYANDMNAMHRIIVGMDSLTLAEHWHTLDELFAGTYDMIRATCLQQFIAAALALGIVKEDELGGGAE
jgi:hypothetical protein